MKLRLNVKGMHCKSCEILIKESLSDINVKADADFKKGVIEVEFDEKEINLEKIKKIISNEGYKVI